MAKFRKKPTIIEAYRFTGESPDPAGVLRSSQDGRAYVVTAHDQPVFLEIGDWIVGEPDGCGYYPIKPWIFATTYEAVDG